MFLPMPALCTSLMGVFVSVQLEVQDRVGKMADLDEQLAEMHKRLEKQLLQQLDTQELLRYKQSLPVIASAYCGHCFAHQLRP